MVTYVTIIVTFRKAKKHAFGLRFRHAFLKFHNIPYINMENHLIFLKYIIVNLSES